MTNKKSDPRLPSMFSQLPGCWGCKDQNSVFVYANEEYSKLVGIEHHDDCVGRTDFDMPSPTTNCAQLFQEQDQMVMKENIKLRVLDIHPYPDGRWRAHIFTKKPWLDDNNNIQGTIFFGQELTDTAILEVGHWICRAAGLNTSAQVSFNVHKHPLQKALNTRESEVLFLLLYGKKPQYIARVLKMTVKTVENHVLKLRDKFNASTKNELVDLALSSGFGSHIPESMLTKQLSIILKE